ncbi:MAG: hypothetical protein QOH58_504 [Thermoleophilaceae bacterium]|nr:hypothetical protein [Thermoleophilaceae bacterium]
MEHEDETRDVDEMEERSEQVGERIEEARDDWDAKQHDPAVPGAQPEPGEEEESLPGVAADEERVAEEGGP